MKCHPMKSVVNEINNHGHSIGTIGMNDSLGSRINKTVTRI
jgi:hypothetical protein